MCLYVYVAYILISTHVTHILILFMYATCLFRYLLSDCVFYIVKKRTTFRLHSLRDWVTGELHKYLKLFFFEIFVYSWFWRQGLAQLLSLSWSLLDNLVIPALKAHTTKCDSFLELLSQRANLPRPYFIHGKMTTMPNPLDSL